MPIFILMLSCLLFFSTQIFAYAVHKDVPSSAPTSFSTEEKLDEEESGQTIRHAPGVQLKEMGLGKVQSLSIRGMTSADVAVTLEGIRLNSVSSGNFDFGNLSTFGLDPVRIIRGGYAPFSSSPNGQVMLRLPSESVYRTKLALGSYQTLEWGLQTPFAVLSVDQSKNDFQYEDGGKTFSRTNNESDRVNLRAWARKENWQLWTQVLYSHQQLPGDIHFPSPGSTSETINPIVAYQGHAKGMEWTTWFNFQQQIFNLPSAQLESVNRWWTSGLKFQDRSELHRRFAIENLLEWTVEDLDNFQHSVAPVNVSSPIRHTLSYATGGYLLLGEAQLIHPRIRIEYLSDLKNEHFSFHPGIGGRHPIFDKLTLLWNLAYISRAPNFNEMYFEIPGLALSNRQLKRQKSLQGDFGYEFDLNDLFSFKQALFLNRSSDLLLGIYENGIYQVRNVGTNVVGGLESEINFDSGKYFDWQLSYTVQRATVNDRQQVDQPTHHLETKPNLKLFENEIQIGLPFYFRSRMPGSQGTEIGPQYDLGLSLQFKKNAWTLQASAFNLLGWDREEVEGFPLRTSLILKSQRRQNFNSEIRKSFLRIKF